MYVLLHVCTIACMYMYVLLHIPSHLYYCMYAPPQLHAPRTLSDESFMHHAALSYEPLPMETTVFVRNAGGRREWMCVYCSLIARLTRFLAARHPLPRRLPSTCPPDQDQPKTPYLECSSSVSQRFLLLSINSHHAGEWRWSLTLRAVFGLVPSPAARFR